MRRFSPVLAVLLVSSCALAQDGPTTDVFTKATPDVEQALRASVDKFFTAHVEGKFRLAEEVVAEDSRDFFYEMEKKRYRKYEIARIAYEDNFTKAKVVTGLEVEWRSPRIGKMIVNTPMTSLWRVENGKWVWYIEKRKDWDTPFGKMMPGQDPESPIIAAFRGVNPNQVLSSVKVSKPEVQLSSFQPASDTIEVTNGMPGEITIEIRHAAMPGLTVKADKTTLKSGEKAIVTFMFEPPNKIAKETQIANVHIEPTNQDIPVKVTFAVPPEIQKQLQRAR